MKSCNNQECSKNNPQTLDSFYTQLKKDENGDEYVYYQNECKECVKLKSSLWRIENQKRSREVKRKSDSKQSSKQLTKIRNRKYRESGKYSEWQRENKILIKGYNYDRQHKNHDITEEEWGNCKEYFNNECAYCGLHISEHFNKYAGEMKWTDFHKEHVDHEGSNDISNCVPSCKACNSSKHTSKFEEWYVNQSEIYSKDKLDKIHQWLINVKSNILHI